MTEIGVDIHLTIACKNCHDRITVDARMVVKPDPENDGAYIGIMGTLAMKSEAKLMSQLWADGHVGPVVAIRAHAASLVP